MRNPRHRRELSRQTCALTKRRMAGARTCVAALAFFVPAAAVAQESGALFVKADKLTRELVTTIARIGEERIIPVKTGTDILKLVSDYCGSANVRRDYLPIFLSANAELEDIRTKKAVTTQDTNFRLPACLFANEQVVAVPVDRSGPRWDKPVAPTPSTTKILMSTKSSASTSLGGPFVPVNSWLKWDPSKHTYISADSLGLWPTDLAATVTGLGSPNEWAKTVADAVSGSSPYQLPAQSLDLGRIAVASARNLPKELSSKGISLTNVVDKKRLDDPEVKAHYERLVAQVLANTEKSGKASDRDLIIRTASLERAFRAQDVLASNDTKDFTKLPTGTVVLSSDFTPGVFYVKVKSEFNAKTAALELVNSTRTSDANAAADPVSNFVPFFARPQSTETSVACKPEAGAAWPFDAVELKKVLALRALAKRRAKLGRMLILDTGFPLNAVGTSPFESYLFVRKTTVASNDPTPHIWSSVVENGNPVYFIPNLQFSSHGVQVLTLALGGIDTWNHKILGSNVDFGDGHIMLLMGYSAAGSNLILSGDAVASSLSGTRGERQAVNVVNLSLSFKMQETAQSLLAARVKLRSHVLFVFAAGNEEDPILDQHPASWGGQSTANVITVGATRPDRTYAKFSNFSPQHVDLAAPGCGVQTLTWNQTAGKFEPILLDGTSLAAPLVSFTANLIHADYGGATGRLKARLIASGGYSADLEGKVWSTRILDIPAAIASPFDVVRMKDNTLRLGRIEWPEAGKVFCDRKHPRSKLRQVHAVGNNAAKISALYYDDSLSQITIGPPCSLNAGELAQISFQESVDGTASPSLGPVQTLDMRALKSITFCDDCYAWP